MTTRLGTIKRLLAILIALAIVLAAGVIVGQAPEIFGAEIDDPEASIEFSDQEGNGSSVTIDHVAVSDGGFVVVTDDEGLTLGVSEYLPAGEHENVTVERGEEVEAEMIGRLTATVHQDTSGNETYAYEETDGAEDRPYLEDGFPVSDSATVTAEDRPPEDAARTSFVVESIDAPEAAATDETIEVVGEIRNPTDHELSQPVEFRVDGSVVEQRVVDLEPGETREVTFEIDLGDVEPGERTYGVYTAEDGQLGEITVEYAGPASVEIRETNASSVTVDAALPRGGFVALEDEDGDIVGTSEPLEPGEHENVTVELEDRLEADAELTAVLYEGDPADVEDAVPVEEDGERVAETVTVEVDAPESSDG